MFPQTPQHFDTAHFRQADVEHHHEKIRLGRRRQRRLPSVGGLAGDAGEGERLLDRLPVEPFIVYDEHSGGVLGHFSLSNPRCGFTG